MTTIDIDHLTPEQLQAARKVALDLGLDKTLRRSNAADALKAATESAERARAELAQARQLHDAEVGSLQAAHDAAIAKMNDSHQAAVGKLNALLAAVQARATDAEAALAEAQAELAAAEAADRG